MSVEQTYLLVMGILVFFALASGLFLMWNARGRQKKES
jgi:hypothetical protein